MFRPWIAAASTCIAIADVAAQNPWTWQDRGMQFDDRAAFTFDLVRGRVVGFGAFGTWELDGDTWLARPSAQAPSNRHGHALAWHPGTGDVVLFGGRAFGANAPYLDETWTWDGIAWTLRTPVAAPSARRLAAMAHDLVRNRVVLFGGTRDNGPLGDTWEWDGTRWWAMQPRNRPPDGRLAPDLNRQVVALLGAPPNPPNASLEHWEWDGTEWQRLTLASAPPATSGFALTEDLGRGRLVLLTGATPAAAPATWEWDGQQWTPRQPSTPPPPIRNGTLVHDPAHRRNLLLGGTTPALAVMPGAASWDGVDWRTGPATPSPPRVAHQSFAYDPVRARVVASGSDLFAVVPVGTWEWDGASWLARSLTPHPAGGLGELAFDPVRSAVLLFGGSPVPSLDGDETWSFSGTAWQRLQPAHHPTARREPVLVTDPVRRRVVMFGGLDMTTVLLPLDETWEWDGVDWSLRQPANPPSPRLATSAAFDAARSVVVLFGGEGRSGPGSNPFATGDTWTWDGVAWRQQNPAASPRAGSRHGVAYEPQRQRVVLFGGLEHRSSGPVYSTTELSEVWEWDGATWTRTVGVSSPPGRARALYEARFGRILKAAFTPSLYAEWPAAATTTGSGCGGSSGPLRLCVSRPELGANVQFDVRTRPAAPGLLVLALGAQNVALGSGCQVLVDEPMTRFWFAANHGGFATVAQAVPLRPELAGVVVLAQSFALDATAPLGFGASARLQIQLGH